MGRGLKEKLAPQFQQSYEDGRLLIVSPFEKHINRVTQQTAAIRNKMIMEIADEIVIGFANPKGKLNVLLIGLTQT